MEPHCIILRYGEIFLKGRNRHFFEKKLITNIKNKLHLKEVHQLQGRLMVDYCHQHYLLRHVFGLVSYSLAWKTGSDLAKIKEMALKILHPRQGTFKVITKRSDKNFPLKSMELNRVVGEYLEEKSSLVFAMENPDNLLYIEVNEKGVYLFTEIIPCHGGIPTGVEGKVLLLMENKSSILAGILIMKRGAEIIPVSLHGEHDLSLLQEYSPTLLKLHHFHSFKEIEHYAQTKGINVLVRGSLFDDLPKNTLEKEDSLLVVFMPLISFTEKEAAALLEKFT